jgi:hypothetical protein
MTLTRYSLVLDTAGTWTLVNEDIRPRASIRTWATKAAATAAGQLATVIGPAGGTVRIHDEAGRFQEERTFPRSADPRRSPG